MSLDKKSSGQWPKVITLEKETFFPKQECWDTQVKKKDILNNLLQTTSSQFLARKLWITPEEETRILELVDLSLKEIQEKNLISQLEEKWITNSKIILTLLVQNNQSCIMTIEWLLKNGLVKKLDEQTFIALLDFPFGVQLVHDVFRGKTLEELMADCRKIIEDKKDVSREVLRKEYAHTFIELNPIQEKATPSPLLMNDSPEKEYTPDLFDTLWPGAIAALLERGMNEAVRAGLEKNMFILDEQITPYLLKLKDNPSFQETSARAVENFESQLKSLSKEKIEAGHEDMMDKMLNTVYFHLSLLWISLHAKPWINYLNLCVAAFIWAYIWWFWIIWTLLNPNLKKIFLDQNETIWISNAYAMMWMTMLCSIILYQLYTYSKSINKKYLEIQSNNSLSRLKRREIRKNDRTVALSEIDTLAKDLLPGSPEYKQLIQFKRAIKNIDTPWSQVSVSPSTVKLYQETPILFFKRTITPPQVGVTKLGGIIADHMDETEDYLHVMQWQISTHADSIQNNGLAGSIKKVAQNKLTELLLSEIDNINTVWQFETLYIGNANTLAQKYYAITPHSWLPNYLKNNSELQHNNKLQKKFKTMVNRIIKNTTTLSELEALLSCNSFRSKFKTDCLYHYSDKIKNNTLEKIKNILLQKARKICVSDPECDITIYNNLTNKITRTI